MSALVITYAVTEDFNGMPWMPDDDGLWGVVARGHGRTKWRHITSRVDLAANGACSSLAAQRNRQLAMSQESNQGRTIAVLHDDELANLQAAAKADAGFDQMLKFKKGVYYVGEEEIPLGTKYLAHAVGWVKCWIKFVDGEVAERKMYRVVNGEASPEREDLDDLDLINKKDEAGLPADPWVFQYLLPLEDMETGEVLIFVTPSFGGKRAIAELCEEYTKHAKKTGGGGQPIIKLEKTDFPSKKFGRVLRPLFEVIGWDEKVDDVKVISPTSDPNDPNDEIPF